MQKEYDKASTVLQALLDKYPKLKAMVDVNYLYDYPVEGVEKWGKVDICPPELIVSDDRIKDMCTAGSKKQP